MRYVAIALLFLGFPQEKRYRLPSTDLKQRVIWGATCEVPDGPTLAFGGQDQRAEDGHPHTRIKEGDEWKPIHDELRAGNPLQGLHKSCFDFRNGLKKLAAHARASWFEGHDPPEEAGQARARLLDELDKPLRARSLELEGYGKDQARRSLEDLQEVRRRLAAVPDLRSAEGVLELMEVQILLEKASEKLDAEPAPRALSPLVYDSKTKRFVLFGGDHLDYLTNDTWVFDPAARRWEQRHPKEAPPPRANHVLSVSGDGTIVLKGGYTYTSSTDYCGGQYRDLNDGEWVYDVQANAWTGSGKLARVDSRTYRTGRLHPRHFLEGPKPDRKAFSQWLADLPANRWRKTDPPRLPALNRDWGTAVLDSDRDLLLRWSGGHSAHGGTDVLHYHLATNRWELTMPVEFPLGQLYSNTEYPEGVNFNRRPWVTGHTYQNYGYDAASRRMLFAGRREHCYVYDPDEGDWTGRFAKPKPMVYGDCFYTLTLTPTALGLVCWTASGQLFLYDAAKTEWVERPVSGGKLPGAVVDNSTVAYDGKRDRLLFWRKLYGEKQKYDGEIHAVDLRTGILSRLAAEGKDAAAAVPYLCQIRYDAGNDLFLVGGTLPPGPDGVRRTPAYDPEANRWVSLKIEGDDPSGKNGRNVSLGLFYEGKRKLFWAVDTNSQVYVLRLDAKSADVLLLGP